MFEEYIVTRMGFTPSSLDGDMYYHRCQCEHGETYYELLLAYVDDVLAISHDPGAIMEVTGKGFEIENNKWGRPTRYLGADVELFTKPDGMKAWSLHCKSYVLAAVETAKDLLAEDGRKLKGPKNQGTSAGALPASYKPEVDVTEECDAGYVSRYQQLIGILRWAVELGRIDISTVGGGLDVAVPYKPKEMTFRVSVPHFPLPDEVSHKEISHGPK